MGDITGISLNKIADKVEKGFTTQLIATLEPSTAEPKPITWESSDNTIATVNDGLVTTLKAGTVDITASVTDEDVTYTAACVIKVIVYPTSIKLNINTIEQHILNETPVETFIPEILPEDATETELTWSSTEPLIVTVDEDNEIEYHNRVGSCIVTVSTVNNLTDSCIVNVYERYPRPDSPVLLDSTKTSISLELGEGIEYSIDNGENYQVSNTFENLTPDTSYMFIQRRYSNGYYVESLPSAELIVSTKDIVHVESIELNTHDISLTIIDTEVDYKFDTIILPEDAEIKDVFYSVDNQAIGAIDSYGNLTVREPGIINVTVTSVDGGLSDSCQVKVYKKWNRPDPPSVQDVTSTTITFKKPSILMEYSIDGGSVWTSNNIFTGLKKKTSYDAICRIKSDGYNLQSDPSSSTSVKTLETDIKPSDRDVHPETITLSAHKLYFDLGKNIHAILNYTIMPLKTTNKSVIWSSNDDRIIRVNSNGELSAVGVGITTVFVKTVDGSITDTCECYVYKTAAPPEQPKAINVDIYSIELKNMGQDIEYSIDGVNWVNTTLFNNLSPESFYTFYQRYKGVGDYQPPSEPSQGLTVKTLRKEKPSGISPSGYKWGQQIEVNDIPIYPSPYSKKSQWNVSGTFYIFSISESNNRIRITDLEDYIDVPGHSLGWVNIKDLKLIETDIYIGDKVIVDGNINIYADGSGIFISKSKAEMYVTDIIDTMEYSYGVTDRPGMVRQGFAKPEMVKKYTIIN